MHSEGNSRGVPVAAAGAKKATVRFDHVAKHVRDVGEQFVAVGAAVGGGGVEVKVGFVTEAHGALGAILGKADGK